MVITARWIAIAMVLLALPSVADAHPLHTTLARVTVDARTGAVNVSLRVFVDDFTAAASDWSTKNRVESESAATAYARASIVIRESSGQAVQLGSCGVKRVGDLMYLCLHGRVSPQATITSVVSLILTERFEDQVNIVQASYAGQKVSMLFSHGDGEKRLPW